MAGLSQFLKAGKLAESLASGEAPMLRPEGGKYLLPRAGGMYPSDVAQEALPRATGRGGNFTPRMQALLDSRAAKRKMDDMINKGNALGMREWYGTQPLRDPALQVLSPEDYDRFMAHMASASQRNPVDKQNQIGSYMWMLDRQGMLTPDTQLMTNAVKRAGATADTPYVELPPGYGSLAQSAIFDRAKKIANDGIDDALPPEAKLGTFYRNLLGNRQPVTVDVNAVRGPIISHGDPDWLASLVTVKDQNGDLVEKLHPRQMYDSGMKMKDLKARPGLWESAPKGSEYAGFEKLWQSGARRHGVDPAEAQAMGWYGSGDITALKTKPELYVDNLERLIKQTADESGQHPLDVLHGVLSGDQSLVGGVARPKPAETSDNFAAGGLAKFAGGGDVAKVIIPYIKRLLPAEYSGMPIKPIRSVSSGRQAFTLGDDYVAKLWNSKYPRGLVENEYQDGLLTGEGILPEKMFVSPDSQLSISRRMTPDRDAAVKFAGPMQRQYMKMEWNRPGSHYSTAHIDDPKLGAMFDDRDLGLLKNYEMLTGDVVAPRHWMQNPDFGRMSMVDEGSMIPNLVSYYSKEKNVPDFAPQALDIVKDRRRFANDVMSGSDAQRRTDNALARAREALGQPDPEAQNQFRDAMGQLDMLGPDKMAGGGVVRNFLRNVGPDVRSGFDDLVGNLRQYTQRSPDVSKWVEKNIPNYLSREFGTQADRLRDVAKEGHLGGIQPDDLSQFIKTIRPTGGIDLPTAVGSHFQQRSMYGYQKSLPDVNEKIPPWLTKAMAKDPNGSFHDINIGHDLWRDEMSPKTYDMLDYLMRNRAGHPTDKQIPNDVANMSVPDAFRASGEYHKKLADDARETNASMTGVTVHKEYPTGHKWVDINGGELKPGFEDEHEAALKDALKAEGQAMGHCVGDYCDDVGSGGSKVYSLRDEKGQPHVTVEVEPRGSTVAKDEDGNIVEGLDASLGRIIQIRGTANTTPNPEYHPFIRDFIKSQPWGDVENPHRFGLRQDPVNGGYVDKAQYDKWRDSQTKLIDSNNPYPGDAPDAAQGFADGGLVTDDIRAALSASERKHGLPDGVLHALAGVESNFDPKVVSPKGAAGLMQLMPKTAKSYGVDPLDPIASADVGGNMLRRLLGRFGNMKDAIAAYNWGEGNLATFGAGKMPKETRDHIAKVYDRWIKKPKEAEKVAPKEIPEYNGPSLNTASNEPGDDEVFASKEDERLYKEVMAMLSGALGEEDEEEATA